MSNYNILDPVPIYNDLSEARWKTWLRDLRNKTNKVDNPADVIVDLTTKGLVLKSPNNHYWRATISNAGVVTWTDLGTAKP
jgi:hypothetical protein